MSPSLFGVDSTQLVNTNRLRFLGLLYHLGSMNCGQKGLFKRSEGRFDLRLNLARWHPLASKSVVGMSGQTAF